MPQKNISKNTAAILALFLGWIGIHHFYMWHKVLGVIYLLFCWTYIPFIISLVESIVIFSMDNTKFQSTYLKKKSGKNNKTQSFHLSKNSPIDEHDDIEWLVDIQVTTSFDDEYSHYWEFISVTWETFNTQDERTYSYPQSFWDSINNAYKEITIKLEWVKQYGDLEGMKQFEQDIHTFFSERVLKVALEKDLIDSLEPDMQSPHYDSQVNSYYRYFWRRLTESEMKEAKRLFMLEQEFYKKSTKRQIYDMYSKSLRRVGNFYKKYKEWELSLNVFLKIRELGFEGIMDGKSIIKCQKELDIKNQKLLK